MATRAGAAAALVVALWTAAAAADEPGTDEPPANEHHWTLEVLFGGAYNVPTPITITQSSEPALSLVAQWETRPFSLPLYYRVRAAWGDASSEWRLELLHHKIYLVNKPPEVQRLEASDGMNLISLSYVWLLGPMTLSVGAGPALPHPESTVRGQKRPRGGGVFGTGYVLAGAGFQAGVGYRLPLAYGSFLALEGSATAIVALIPIVAGDVTVTNVALHGNFGLGWSF